MHWGLSERRRSFPYSGRLQHVTYPPGAPGEHDASLLTEAEVRAALIYE